MRVTEGQYPRQLADVDRSWIEQSVRHLTPGREVGVTGVEVHQIGEGVGFLGELGRLIVRYDTDDPALPHSLIAKFSSPDPAIRQFVAMYGMYRSEVNFYREIAGSISLRTPKCYFSAISEDGTQCALLFEDLETSGRVGDQIAGCTLREAGVAIDQLASFHATLWDAPAVAKMDWLPVGADLACAAFQQSYPLGWKPCLDRFGHLFSKEIRDAMPTLNERAIAMLQSPDMSALTVAHGDFRLDNLFFGSDSTDYELAVIDWQLANRGRGTYDIAYFIATNLDSAERQKCEFDLLRSYHQRLREGGVRDYSWQQCEDDYRRAMIVLVTTTITGIMNIDSANERGVALFDLILRRVSAAVTDLDAFRMLTD